MFTPLQFQNALSFHSILNREFSSLVASGSFVHDVDLKIGDDWTPTKEELMVLSATMHRIAEKNLPFERLVTFLRLRHKILIDSNHVTMLDQILLQFLSTIAVVYHNRIKGFVLLFS